MGLSKEEYDLVLMFRQQIQANNTRASTGNNFTSNIENITNFSEIYNDLGLNAHMESYTVK